MGYRSLGPIRAQLYGGSDYAANANEEIVALAMIETMPGLENLDAILKVEGLDGIYIGPADLSLSFGLPGRLDPVDVKKDRYGFVYAEGPEGPVAYNPLAEASAYHL